MYIICGLGNPGMQYEMTRHNMGFMALDVLSSRFDIPIKKLKFKALIGEGYIGTEKVVLVKPQTFMNNSGEALRPIADFYKVSHDRIIVIYDDIDLSLGTIRVRKSGSAGTHNGMRSVIYQLQFDDFPRVRVGLGDHGIIPLMDFVIGKVSEAERPAVAQAVERAASAAEMIVRQGADRAMNAFNIKPSTEKKQKAARAAAERAEAAGPAKAAAVSSEAAGPAKASAENSEAAGTH